MRRGFQPRRPYRPGRGRILTQSSSRNLHAAINLSDSYYDSDSSDDIIVLNVKHTSNNQPLLLSESDESSSPDTISFTNVTKQNRPKEVDWNSRKTPPEIHKKRIEKEDHLRGQSKPFDITNSSYSSSSYSIEEEPNQNIKPKENDVKSLDVITPKRSAFPRNNKKQTEENHNKSEYNKSLDPNYDKNPLYQEPQNATNDIQDKNTEKSTDTKENNSKTNTNDDLNNNPSSIENQNSHSEPVKPLPDPIENIDSKPFQSFTIARKGKKFSKISFELLEDNTIILKSSPKKEGKKSIQLIYKEDTVSSLPKYEGYLRSRKKKHFYTFYTIDKKNERDDREGELLSICFNNYNQEANRNSTSSIETNKSITVVIPKYGSPNYPITQRLSLENFAVTNSIDQSNFIKLVGTEITPEVESEYGSSFYTKSGKNCALIEPNTNKYVFIFLKSNYEIFNLKVRPPLTVIQGFALAIALIKHDQ